jgi:GTP cyclohydrolase I
MKINGNNTVSMVFDESNNHHVSVKNPLRDDAFFKDDETKIELIKQKFEEILQIIGLDLKDDSLKETPHRIAKMYINEIFSGINPKTVSFNNLITLSNSRLLLKAFKITVFSCIPNNFFLNYYSLLI